jgi:hypothetical protein
MEYIGIGILIALGIMVAPMIISFVLTLFMIIVDVLITTINAISGNKG